MTSGASIYTRYRGRARQERNVAECVEGALLLGSGVIIHTVGAFSVWDGYSAATGCGGFGGCDWVGGSATMTGI